MNGLEMARVVRDRYPGIPVVLTSGYSDALTEGFEDFKLVKKPYSVEVLSRVLQTALVGRL
jgi:DNA-binding LytR/AlgR family response regulator